MIFEEFWRFVERSGDGRSDPAARAAWLVDRLSHVSANVSVEFELRLGEVRKRVDTYLMWDAADIIFGGCSSDCFFYFQYWLVGLGQEIFDRVASDPDALASVPQIQHLASRSSWTDAEFPWWEELHAVARVAYEAHTGHSDALDERVASRGQPKTHDPEPGPSERRDLPRLRELFLQRPRPTADGLVI